MPRADIEIVQQLVDAFNSGDIDGILALTHHSVGLTEQG